MKIEAKIEALPGRGYTLLLHDAVPEGFNGRFRVQLEELSYYSQERGDDVCVLIDTQTLVTHIEPGSSTGAFEVTFQGTIGFDVPDANLPEFRRAISERGVDYCLEMVSDDDNELLASGDDWEFIQNFNLRLELVADD